MITRREREGVQTILEKVDSLLKATGLEKVVLQELAEEVVAIVDPLVPKDALGSQGDTCHRQQGKRGSSTEQEKKEKNTKEKGQHATRFKEFAPNAKDKLFFHGRGELAVHDPQAANRGRRGQPADQREKLRFLPDVFWDVTSAGEMSTKRVGERLAGWRTRTTGHVRVFRTTRKK